MKYLVVIFFSLKVFAIEMTPCPSKLAGMFQRPEATKTLMDIYTELGGRWSLSRATIDSIRATYIKMLGEADNRSMTAIELPLQSGNDTRCRYQGRNPNQFFEVTKFSENMWNLILQTPYGSGGILVHLVKGLEHRDNTIYDRSELWLMIPIKGEYRRILVGQVYSWGYYLTK